MSRRTIIELLRNDFAFTVLDCEHHIGERTLAALDSADRIVLVTELTVTALAEHAATLGICRRLGYPDEKLCVVVNRFQSGEVLSPADASDLLKSRDLLAAARTTIARRRRRSRRGEPCTEGDPLSQLSIGFAQLAAKLGGDGAQA